MDKGKDVVMVMDMYACYNFNLYSAYNLQWILPFTTRTWKTTKYLTYEFLVMQYMYQLHLHNALKWVSNKDLRFM